MFKSIAVISANFGGIDDAKPLIKQNINDFDCFSFNESNSPFPFSAFNNRLTSRYYKTQSHKISQLYNYRYHLWIDSNLEVINSDMVGEIMEKLGNNQILIETHPERNCLYKERDYIKQNIGGSDYLKARYSTELIDLETKYYKSLGMPKEFGFWACNIFLRDTYKTNYVFNKWFDISCKFSSATDQFSFAFLNYVHKIKIAPIDYGEYWNNKYFIHHNHQIII